MYWTSIAISSSLFIVSRVFLEMELEYFENLHGDTWGRPQ